MRWAALGFVLAGCLHGSSHTCTSDDGTQSWVCPELSKCAAPPVYCGTAAEVGACEGKPDRNPCSTDLVADGQCISGECQACDNDIAGCRYVGWAPMTSSASQPLHGVSFPGFGEAYAAGDNGTMLRYDTSRWLADTRFPTDATTQTTQIISVQAADQKIYAYGGKTVYILDGDTWSQLSGLGKLYKAMWVAPDGTIFVVGLGQGLSGEYAIYNGSWNETTMGSYVLQAVSGTSASDVFAVGTTSGAASAVIHYDGTAWPSVPTANVGALNAVWTINGEVFAGGAGFVHGTAAGMTALPAPPSTIRAMWGSSATDVFATGDAGTIMHWDGVSWTKMVSGSNAVLSGVAGSSAEEVFAVGDAGAILRYTGAAWAEVASQPTGSPALTGVFAGAPNDVIAVGGQSIFHFHDATGWGAMPETTLSKQVVGVWGRSPSDVIAVGNLVSSHYNGSAWSDITPTLFAGSAIWGDASAFYAVSPSIGVYTYGSSWNQTATGNGLSGLWVAPGGRIYVAGTSGIAHVDGSALTMDLAGMYASVWGSSDSDVFAAGAGDIHHFDGASWTAMTIPSSAALTSVWGRSSDDVFAVGASNTMLHFHAGLWKSITPPSSGNLVGVTGSGSSIWIAAANGTLFRLIESAP